MADQQAERIMALFTGSEDAHGTHGAPARKPHSPKWEIRSTAKTLRGPATLTMWKAHLEGKTPLGVIPIMRDGKCMWASLDIDEYDDPLAEMVARVEKAKLPLVPCRSKSGGLHFWLFLAQPTQADLVQAALRNVAAHLGFGGCEIFPKQTYVLSERGDTGNWMVMPYFGGTFDGKLKTQVGIKKTGAEMTIGEFLGIAEKSRVTEEQVVEMGEKRAAGTKGGKKVSKANTPFGDGPPCLQHMADGGFPEGGRNNSLFMIGLYLKRASPMDWQEKLEESNRQHMQPPLDSEEVQIVVKQLEKREYQYTCKTEPMASHCDAARCRARKYGVGNGASPVINSIEKLDIEPAIWFVGVEDKRLELSTAELQNFVLFHRACMERANKCFQTMTQKDWLAVLADAMEHMTTSKAPPDASAGGVFLEYLEEFLTGRGKGDRVDDLLLGRPWHDEENKRHYFQMRDFQKFLGRENVRDMTRGQIIRRIQNLKGGGDKRNISGKFRNLWWVPDDVIDETAEVAAPKMAGEEV